MLIAGGALAALPPLAGSGQKDEILAPPRERPPRPLRGQDHHGSPHGVLRDARPVDDILR
jgi:hypothetical protein